MTTILLPVYCQLNLANFKTFKVNGMKNYIPPGNIASKKSKFTATKDCCLKVNLTVNYSKFTEGKY